MGGDTPNLATSTLSAEEVGLHTHLRGVSAGQITDFSDPPLRSPAELSQYSGPNCQDDTSNLKLRYVAKHAQRVHAESSLSSQLGGRKHGSAT